MIKRRLGLHPHFGGNNTPAITGCPDMFELDNGDLAIIGIRKTEELKKHLPSDAGCGPDEEIVIVPRNIFVNAKSDILNL